MTCSVRPYASGTRSEGLKCVEGQVLRENATMLQMCRELWFHIVDDPDDRTVKVVFLQLQ